MAYIYGCQSKSTGKMDYVGSTHNLWRRVLNLFYPRGRNPLAGKFNEYKIVVLALTTTKQRFMVEEIWIRRFRRKRQCRFNIKPVA